MLENIKGHIFYLAQLDGEKGVHQQLTFVSRIGPKYPFNYVAFPGTTTQEVIRALIARIKWVELQEHHSENGEVIEGLRQALRLLESRAKKVLGQTLHVPSYTEIEGIPTCPVCLHIHCTKH